VTLALDLKPVASGVQQFAFSIANATQGSVLGQVLTIIVVVIREEPPACGNRVLDGNETCDPPGLRCPLGTRSGFCETTCTCVSGRFIDNSDGTVTDPQTGLQWEQKTGSVGSISDFKDCSQVSCPDPHDVNNRYQWCLDANHDRVCDGPGFPDNGGAFVDFLAALNAPPCFAGHCDWRLPTVNRDGGSTEFETIVDVTRPGCFTLGGGTAPCIDPIFGPTIASTYWSRTTTAFSPLYAWFLSFFDGVVDYDNKFESNFVRAVRDAD
jgi:hypothetical protein